MWLYNRSILIEDVVWGRYTSAGRYNHTLTEYKNFNCYIIINHNQQINNSYQKYNLSVSLIINEERHITMMVVNYDVNINMTLFLFMETPMMYERAVMYDQIQKVTWPVTVHSNEEKCVT